jgi:hypothetical protein
MFVHQIARCPLGSGDPRELPDDGAEVSGHRVAA